METHPTNHGICGVILAGGQASRMNFLDKPLIPIANRSLIEYVIASAMPQLSQLVISVNRSLGKYEKFHLPLITDIDNKEDGPLVGIYSAMNWYSEQNVSAEYLACFPADVPIFPADVVFKLKQTLAINQQAKSPGGHDCAKVSWCQTGQQIQPLFSLWSFQLLSVLEQSIRQGICGPKLFFEQHPNIRIQLPEPENGMFLNVNTPEDLVLAESFLTGTDIQEIM